jgi:hypothetical protein
MLVDWKDGWGSREDSEGARPAWGVASENESDADVWFAAWAPSPVLNLCGNPVGNPVDREIPASLMRAWASAVSAAGFILTARSCLAFLLRSDESRPASVASIALTTALAARVSCETEKSSATDETNPAIEGPTKTARVGSMFCARRIS